jgi:hypothetical protein
MNTIVTRAGVRDEHVVVPFAEGAVAGQTARLSFDNGVSQLDLHADADLDDLLDARLTDPLPVVWAADHNVHVEYPLGSRLLRVMAPNTIRISPRVPWAIDVHGGAERLNADLTGVDVRSIAVHSGAARTSLMLGHPTGPCTIRFAAVKDLHIRRPADVPVRVEIARGSKNVTMDSRTFGAVGGGLSDQTPGYDAAGARYLVIVAGGASTVTVEGSTA